MPVVSSTVHNKAAEVNVSTNMQALLDEQRSAQVHVVLLATLLQLRSAFQPSVTAAALRIAAQGASMARLATSGSEHLLDSVEAADGDQEVEQIAVGSADEAAFMLACAGLDIVALVRHDGLTCPADPLVGIARYPAQEGRRCAHYNLCRLRSLIWCSLACMC